MSGNDTAGSSNNNTNRKKSSSSSNVKSSFISSLPSRNRKRRHQLTLLQSALAHKKTKNEKETVPVLSEPIPDQVTSNDNNVDDVTNTSYINDTYTRANTTKDNDSASTCYERPIVQVKLENDQVRKEKGETKKIESTRNTLSHEQQHATRTHHELNKLKSLSSSSSSSIQVHLANAPQKESGIENQVVVKQEQVKHKHTSRKKSSQSLEKNDTNDYHYSHSNEIDDTNMNVANNDNYMINSNHESFTKSSIPSPPSPHDSHLPLPPSPPLSSSSSSSSPTNSQLLQPSNNNLTLQLQELISSHKSTQISSLKTQLKHYQTENKSLKQQLSINSKKKIQDESIYYNECKSLQRQVCALQMEVKSRNKKLELLQLKLDHQEECFKMYKDRMKSWLEEIGFRFPCVSEDNNSGCSSDSSKCVLTRVVKWELMIPPLLSNTMTFSSTLTTVNDIAKDKENSDHTSIVQKDERVANENNSTLIVTQVKDGKYNQASIVGDHSSSIINRNTNYDNKCDNPRGHDDNNEENQTNHHDVQRNENQKSIQEINHHDNLTTQSSTFVTSQKIDHVLFSIKKVNNQNPTLLIDRDNNDVVDDNNDHNNTQEASIRFEVGTIVDDGKASNSCSSSSGDSTNGCDLSDDAVDTQHYQQTNASEVYDFSCAVYNKKSPPPYTKGHIPSFVTPAISRGGQLLGNNNNIHNNLKQGGNIVTDRKMSSTTRSNTDNYETYESTLFDESCPSPTNNNMKVTKTLVKVPICDVSNDLHVNEHDSRFQNEVICQPTKDTKEQHKSTKFESKRSKISMKDPIVNNTCDVRDKEMDDTKLKENKFKYQEVVRGKKAREALNGYFCEQCNEFADAVCDHPGGDVFDRKMFTTCSRHRARYSPPQTPVDFWELDFIDERKAKSAAEKENIGNSDDSRLQHDVNDV